MPLPSMPEPKVKPISECSDPETLDDFFKIHPLDWTRDHIRTIVAGLTKQSMLWAQEQSKARATNKTRQANGEKKKVRGKTIKSSNILADDISTDDLLGDLDKFI